ncbi:MAG: hypothetical protein CALGDGBN_02628 [Pseudomonadales bacterium]|nr:hypothetical protein [Pseudomonadales bacterium]
MTAHAQPWQAFMQDMAQLEQELLAIAPDCELAHAEAQRYLARLLRYAIGRHIDRTGSPARPVISQETARIGGDNPDYRYGTADLDGRLRYRVAGRLNDAYRLGIGTYAGGLGTAQGLRGTGYVNVDARMVDDSGRFELILSTETVPGHWLPMATGTNSLIIRQLVLDPQAHRPAEIAIECLSGADCVELRPVAGDELLARMAHARQFLAGTVRQFIGWSASFARFPNAVRPLDPALLGAAQGDPGTRYFNGYYRLQPGEALVVEFTPPPCDYWNLQACNHWLESLDILRQPAHINHYTAKADANGRVRAVITPECPGVDNWIDTVGHREGCLAMRWVGLAAGHEPPALDCRVCAVASLGA